MVAGAIIGWVGIDFVGGALKLGVPIFFNVACAFVGGLIAYTLLR